MKRTTKPFEAIESSTIQTQATRPTRVSMRLITRLFSLVAIVSVVCHFACINDHCPVIWEAYRPYFSLSHLDELISSRNKLYKVKIAPHVATGISQYQKYAEPRLKDLSVQVNEKLVLPVAYKVNSINWHDLGIHLISKGQVIALETQKQYRVHISPLVQHGFTKIKPYLQQINHRLSPIIAEMQNHLLGSTGALQSKLIDLKPKIAYYLHLLMSNAAIYKDSAQKRFDKWKKGGHDIVTKYKKEFSTNVESMISESTSTRVTHEVHMDTPTPDETTENVPTNLKQSMQETDIQADVQRDETGDSSDLEVDEHTAFNDDFQIWHNSINKKNEKVESVLAKDIRKFIDGQIKKLEPSWKDFIKEMEKQNQIHFTIINKAILDTNCTEEVDPSTGNVIYFDKTGTTQLDTYVTRELMREYIRDANQAFENRLHEIKSHLQSELKKMNKRLNLIREEHLDVYEEWGEVMVSEISKRLAYLDVISNANKDEGKIIDNEANWEKHLEIKRAISATRDRLANYEIDASAFKRMIDSVEKTLETLHSEFGEYMYILRSKANIAFQEREAQERKSKEDNHSSDANHENITEQQESFDHKTLNTTAGNTIDHNEIEVTADIHEDTENAQSETQKETVTDNRTENDEIENEREENCETGDDHDDEMESTLTITSRTTVHVVTSLGIAPSSVVEEELEQHDVNIKEEAETV